MIPYIFFPPGVGKIPPRNFEQRDFRFDVYRKLRNALSRVIIVEIVLPSRNLDGFISFAKRLVAWLRLYFISRGGTKMATGENGGKIIISRADLRVAKIEIG